MEIPVERPMTRDISITSLDYGYMVRVGCQTFAMENKEVMLKAITAYLANPAEVERNWMKSKHLPVV
jgi:hypothetical protein